MTCGPVRGEPPESLRYSGAAKPLGKLWIAVRASLREVLEHVTLADIANNSLPEIVDEITADPKSWVMHD